MNRGSRRSAQWHTRHAHSGVGSGRSSVANADQSLQGAQNVARVCRMCSGMKSPRSTENARTGSKPACGVPRRMRLRRPPRPHPHRIPGRMRLLAHVRCTGTHKVCLTHPHPPTHPPTHKACLSRQGTRVQVPRTPQSEAFPPSAVRGIPSSPPKCLALPPPVPRTPQDKRPHLESSALAQGRGPLSYECALA